MPHAQPTPQGGCEEASGMIANRLSGRSIGGHFFHCVAVGILSDASPWHVDASASMGLLRLRFELERTTDATTAKDDGEPDPAGRGLGRETANPLSPVDKF